MNKYKFKLAVIVSFYYAVSIALPKRDSPFLILNSMFYSDNSDYVNILNNLKHYQ